MSHQDLSHISLLGPLGKMGDLSLGGTQDMPPVSSAQFAELHQDYCTARNRSAGMCANCGGNGSSHPKPAELFCDECQLGFCRECADIVHKLPVFSHHTLSNIHFAFRHMMCPRHHCEIRYFCKTCYQLLCNECLITHNTSHQRLVIDIHSLKEGHRSLRRLTKLMEDALTTAPAAFFYSDVSKELAEFSQQAKGTMTTVYRFLRELASKQNAQMLLLPPMVEEMDKALTEAHTRFLTLKAQMQDLLKRCEPLFQTLQQITHQFMAACDSLPTTCCRDSAPLAVNAQAAGANEPVSVADAPPVQHTVHTVRTMMSPEVAPPVPLLPATPKR
eukprot:gnl/Trimastix_PCT/3248.p1 GENE.gnl/Trimastix_PCT/3248~~gnl/Trimastix_PCT/3248.p1  ORF type:complete len:331 (+),score=52.07 gnl/Trimastix_PCT/3248:74-1066(+)